MVVTVDSAVIVPVGWASSLFERVEVASASDMAAAKAATGKIAKVTILRLTIVAFDRKEAWYLRGPEFA